MLADILHVVFRTICLLHSNKDNHKLIKTYVEAQEIIFDKSSEKCGAVSKNKNPLKQPWIAKDEKL